MRNRETIRPYTVPIHAPDSTFVSVYAWDIQRQPLLLFGLRRDDGTLYLPVPERNNRLRKHLFTHAIQPESEHAS